MDKHNYQKLVAFLKQLGVTPDEAEVYLFLVQNGEQAVLAISRGLSTGRTKLYPLLERLAEKQLVVTRDRHYGSSYSAMSLESLENIVAEQERLSSATRSALPFMTNTLRSLASAEVVGTKVIQLRGVDGLKQAIYNLTRARGEYRCFEVANLDQQPSMTQHFAEKQRRTQVEKGIISYDLTNNPDWIVKTNVEGYDKISKAAYIDPKVFKIQFEMMIYNDVVALVNYDPKDLVCVEIHNQALANQQIQMFDLLWSQSKPISY